MTLTKSINSRTDLAHFHAFASEKYSLTAANKWVSFGGSYPGMLAGWFRLKFPNLVHASVASSAPVKAKVDMQEYNDVTAAAYAVSDNNVGGSPACTRAIAVGHATIGTMFGTLAVRTSLAKLFGKTAQWYESRSNQGQFAGNGVGYFPAQVRSISHLWPYQQCVPSGSIRNCTLTVGAPLLHRATILLARKRAAILVRSAR